MNTVVVIPARFASERLPGKPLLSETGKPLIQHVYEQVRKARLPDEVVVATDDRRIYDAVRRFGGKVVMTSREHASGTDRVAEAVKGLPHAFVINVQGDEPEIEPALIDRLARTLKEDRKADWVTAARPTRGSKALAEPSVVKVAVDREGYALYFSRSVIPYDRDRERARGIPARALVHVGVYGFRREALLRFSRTPPSTLERVERLEQLRALELGQRIRVLETRRASRSIDTPADYRRFVQRRRARR